MKISHLLLAFFIGVVICHNLRAEEKIITGIPHTNWYYFRDVSNNAVVTIDSTRNNLYLHTFDDKVTHLQTSESYTYMYAKLSDKRDLLLVCEYLDEAEYRYSIYDYDGNLLYPHVTLPYVLTLSEYSDFYLTTYALGDAVNTPAVISLSGEMMFEFKPEFETGWDLKEIDSTKVLFRNGGNVYIYNSTDFSIVDVIETAADSLMSHAPPSIVAGNRYYGFRTYTKIIIVDLESGEIKAEFPYSVKNRIFKNPGIVIDAVRHRLLLFYVTKSSSLAEIYSFEKSKPKLLSQTEILMQDIQGFAEELSFAHKGFFILNFYRSRNLDVYRSMIITLLQNEQTPELLTGILLPKADDSGELMQVSLVNHTLIVKNFIEIE